MLGWSNERLFWTLLVGYLIALEGASFLTSDAPLCIINPENYGYCDQCPPFHVFLIKHASAILETIGHNWVTALGTVAIAYFTLTIRNINKSQLSHANRVERAYISGGGFGERTAQIVTTPTGHPVQRLQVTGAFQVQINNHGKTTGEVFRVAIEFRNADATLPEEPIYENFIPHHNWIGPGTQSRPLFAIPPPAEMRNPMIVYGRFYYRDIFSPTEHSSGFFQDFNRETGDSRSIVPPSRRYTEWT